jgi:hypothetical protein
MNKGLTPAVVDHTIEGAEKRQASCRLYMRMKKDAKVADGVVDRYIGFLTNMSIERVILAYDLLPEEYHKRWGTETGFKVQDNVQAKTASRNFTVRPVLAMFSTILYNIWVLANVVLAEKRMWNLKSPGLSCPISRITLADELSNLISLLKTHLRNYCRGN